MKYPPSVEERTWAVVSHLSALALGLGILLPVVGWSEQRRKSNYAAFQCLQALGYQSLGYTIWILSSLAFIVFFMVVALGAIARAESMDAALGPWLIGSNLIIFGLIGSYFMLPVIAAVACALGRDFRYPIMGPRLARFLGYRATMEEGWLVEDHEDRWAAATGHFSVIIVLWGMLAPLTAWILQGERSFFLKFQSIQALVLHLVALLLQLVAGAFYLLGFIVFLVAIGFGEDAALTSSGSLIGLIVLFMMMLIAMVIVLLVPVLHIMGQWAGYRVLKGDDYCYPIVGRLVEKRLSSTDQKNG